MITIFTPTYNRGYIIETLYYSLCRQTNKDFEWLIIDDGSMDNTREIIQTFIKEGLVNIRYFEQPNRGKHRAINYGVMEACGDLFFIVDSDDYLADNALEHIYKYYSDICEDDSFCGLCGLKAHFNGDIILSGNNFGILDCSLLDFRYKYHYKGDAAEIYKTDILRQYPFPEIEDEKFCPEGLVWFRMSDKYKLRFFYEKIYFCEYLNDGLTNKIINIRRTSPIASLTYYSELYKRKKIPIFIRLKSAINFWRFLPSCFGKEYGKKFGMITFITIWMYPIGRLMNIMDVLRNKLIT